MIDDGRSVDSASASWMAFGGWEGGREGGGKGAAFYSILSY